MQNTPSKCPGITAKTWSRCMTSFKTFPNLCAPPRTVNTSGHTTQMFSPGLAHGVLLLLLLLLPQPVTDVVTSALLK